MAPGSRPQFERDIRCNRCDVLTMEEVELTEWGQRQLSELYFLRYGRETNIRLRGFKCTHQVGAYLVKGRREAIKERDSKG
jgi:hypothetical protein